MRLTKKVRLVGDTIRSIEANHAKTEGFIARIPLIDESDPNIDPNLRATLREAGASRGWMVNVFQAVANRPPR